MIRTLVTAVLAAVLLAGFWAARPVETAPHNIRIRGEGRPGNPGWFAQLHEMKTNARGGSIPARFRLRLWQHWQAHKTATTNLLNVTEVGPRNVGGRTRALIIDHEDSQHYIAGGVSGGVWHSYDAGQTWTPVTDFGPTLSVTDIDQSPLAPHILYYCTGEPSGNSADITGDGLFKSADGGLTWFPLPATDSPTFELNWAIRCSPLDSSTLYVATHNHGLWRSTNGGGSFQRVCHPAGPSHVTDVELLPDGGVICGIRDRGIWYSATGDTGTFTQLTTGLPPDGFRAIRVAVCESQPNTLYAAFENAGPDAYYSELKGIYRSDDGGATWAETLTLPDRDYGMDMLFPWYAFAFAVSPTDPDFILVGSVELAASEDGGATWETCRYSHADHHVIRFLPGGLQYLNGNDGGIYRYSRATQTSSTTSLNNGYNVTQYYAGTFFPGTSTDAYGGTQDNGTNVTKLNAAVFTHIFGGDGSYCQINQQQSNVGFVSYQNGEIYRTNGAMSPQPSFTRVVNQMDADNDGEHDDPVWFINPYEMNQQDGSQLFFPTRRRLWRSNNNGSAWTPITQNLGNSCYSVGISNENDPTVYVGGPNNFLYRIDNARTATPGSEVSLGATSPTAIAGSFYSNLCVHPDDPGILFVSCSDYLLAPRVWMVLFANTSSPAWVDISGDLPPGLPVNWITVDPAQPYDFWVVGTDWGVYSTANGGATWQKETAFPNVAVFQVKIRPDDRKLFVWTHGRGLWTARLPAVSGQANATPRATPTLQVAPNPTPGPISLQLAGSPTTQGQLEVLDAAGRVVQRHSLPPAPIHHLNLQALPPRAYTLRLAGPGSALSRRVVLSH
jgi:photosystem II stability/assembly factor-like uncharacterized protein